MGVFPIDRRVGRVECDAQGHLVRCYDQQGTAFFTLSRQADGRFKGVLEVMYHELAAPARPHSWGHVLAEFFLPADAFKPPGAPGPQGRTDL